MTPALREQFERLALRLAELDATLADPQVAGDIKRWRSLSREQAEAQDIVGRFRRWQQREADLAAAREMAAAESIARATADYIAGMTDRYSMKEHRRLFSVGEL